MVKWWLTFLSYTEFMLWNETLWRYFAVLWSPVIGKVICEPITRWKLRYSGICDHSETHGKCHHFYSSVSMVTTPVGRQCPSQQCRESAPLNYHWQTLHVLECVCSVHCGHCRLTPVRFVILNPIVRPLSCMISQSTNCLMWPLYYIVFYDHLTHVNTFSLVKKWLQYQGSMHCNVIWLFSLGNVHLINVLQAPW